MVRAVSNDSWRNVSNGNIDDEMSEKDRNKAICLNDPFCYYTYLTRDPLFENNISWTFFQQGAIIDDFFSSTTVHGIKYFSGKEHHWAERSVKYHQLKSSTQKWNRQFLFLMKKYQFRIWWMTSFALSVVLCVIAILSIWTRWSDHPVTVIFDDKVTAISDIPFPAITVCTTQKFSVNLDDNEKVMGNFFSYK